MTHSRLARRVAVLGATIALVLASCADATGVRVHVYTDIAWENGRRVVIAASSEAPSPSEPLAEVPGPWASTDLGDFVLVPAGAKTAPIRLAVVMGITKDARACSLEAPDGCVFTRRKLAFLDHRTLTVPVTVHSACLGVPCTPDTTCNVLGKCVSAEVDPEVCASPDGCLLPGETAPTSFSAPVFSDAGAGDTPVLSDAGAGDAAGTADAGSVVQVDLALGHSHSCVRSTDGRIHCWGANGVGQLGLGDTATRGVAPAQMGSALAHVDLGTGRSARALVAGGYHTCALLDNGQVKCWGDNGSGRLGLGDVNSRGGLPGEMGDALSPVDLGAGRTARALAAGNMHTCALLDNDQIKCWGINNFGELGLGDVSHRGDALAEMGDALPYVNLGTGRSARALTAGKGSHTCALLDNGQIKCWGTNNFGQLGLGDVSHRGDALAEMGDALPAVDLGTGRTARALDAGDRHTCALLDNDQVKCWGYNNVGQLGVADSNHRGDQFGEMGDALPYVNLGTGHFARALALGDIHTCALLANDQVKCWGFNAYGQLGLGNTGNRTPGDALPYADLGTGRSARMLASGREHVCAVLDNGQAKCWGYNNAGQLGLGDTANRGDQPGEMGDVLPFVDVRQ